MELEGAQKPMSACDSFSATIGDPQTLPVTEISGLCLPILWSTI